ncbi:MAG: CbbQ/NirQ/NorQ C-terminal domain-containing protein, partial [Clostridiales Family XIII bacterium]|nr:CbbQ/NirQ/NorQ C-terminal domain-containing protein [Clostridiales Family XIII bacterium]
ILCELSYPEPNREIALLKNIIGSSYTNCSLNEELIKRMVAFANDVRERFIQYSNGYKSNSAKDPKKNNAAPIDITFSTRTLIRWAKLLVNFSRLSKNTKMSTIEYALNSALGFRATTATRYKLKELGCRYFGSMNFSDT